MEFNRLVTRKPEQHRRVSAMALTSGTQINLQNGGRGAVGLAAFYGADGWAQMVFDF